MSDPTRMLLIRLGCGAIVLFCLALRLRAGTARWRQWGAGAGLWLLLPLVGGLIIAVSTHQGIGVSSDSTIHIGVAKSIQAGNGLVIPVGTPRPLTHFPPLYPILLSIFGNPIGTARALSIILFAAAILLIGLLHRKNAVLAAAGMIVAVTNPELQKVFSFAWSETLFIFLVLLGWFSLLDYLRNGRFLAFIASALLIGMSAVTRYAGLAFVFAGAALVLREQIARRQIIKAALYFSVASLPLLAQSIRNLMLFGNATNRTLAFHFIPMNLWWLAISLLSLLLFLAYRKKDPEGYLLIRSGSIFGFFYGIFMFASTLFFDAQTPLDGRLLSPILVLSAAVFVSVFSEWKQASVPLLIMLVFAQVIASSFFLYRTYHRGLGYNSPFWRASALVETLNHLPAESNVCTNDIYALIFLSKFKAVNLPQKYDPTTLKANEDYQDEIKDICKGDYLVYFRFSRRDYMPSHTEIAANPHLEKIIEIEEGTIYKVIK